ASAQRRVGGVGDVLRGDLPRPRTLLRLDDRGFDQVTAENLGGLRQPWVGEHAVGPRAAPSWLRHSAPPADRSPRRRTGIEPANDRVCRSTVLKTGPVTRPEAPPCGNTVVIADMPPSSQGRSAAAQAGAGS